MRKLLLFLLLTPAACTQNNTGKPAATDRNIAAAGDSIPPVSAPYDSTYYIGDFRIQADFNTRFDLVDNHHSPTVLTSKGDTLYADSAVTLLGDASALNNQVYRKYTQPFHFENYPVQSLYRTPLAAPDFTTDKDARMFRTRIKEGCAKMGVNFAGHYTIVEWGCGMECGMMAMTDRYTGQIHFSDLKFDIEEGYYGAAYKADSRLLILNSFSLDSGYTQVSGGQQVQFYEWNDTGFHRLD